MKPARILLAALALAVGVRAAERPGINITIDNVPLTPGKAKERVARLEALQKRARELTARPGNEQAALDAIEAELAYLIQTAPRAEDRVRALQAITIAKWLHQIQTRDRDGVERLLRRPPPSQWGFPTQALRTEIIRAVDENIERRVGPAPARDALPADESLPRAADLHLCLRGRAFRDALRGRTDPTRLSITDAPLAWATSTYLKLSAAVTAAKVKALDAQYAARLDQARKLVAQGDRATARAAFDMAAKLRPLRALAFVDRIATEVQWGAGIRLDPTHPRDGKAARLLGAILDLDVEDPQVAMARAAIVVATRDAPRRILDATARILSERLVDTPPGDGALHQALRGFRAQLHVRLGRPGAHQPTVSEARATLIQAIRANQPGEAARLLDQMSRNNEMNLLELQRAIDTPQRMVEALRVLGIPGIRQLEPMPAICTRILGNLRAYQKTACVSIAKAEFTMGGSGDISEKPPHRVALDAYWLQRTEATVADYARFLREVDNGHFSPPDRLLPFRASLAPLDWPTQLKSKAAPVRGLTWYAASSYAWWQFLELPTEAQWEFAARGRDGRIFPWGNDAAVARRLARHQPTVADAADDDKTPEGILHLGGNVAEWCRDTYAPGYYRRAPRLNPINTAAGRAKAVRGGSHRAAKPYQFRGARRVGLDPRERRPDVGFRLVLEE